MSRLKSVRAKMFHFAVDRRGWYPVLFVLLVSVFFVLAYWANPSVFLTLDQSLVIAVTGAIGGFVYFLYAQHQQNTQLFVSLFDKFNERYNSLNGKLNAIVKRDQNLALHEVRG